MEFRDKIREAFHTYLALEKWRWSMGISVAFPGVWHGHYIASKN